MDAVGECYDSTKIRSHGMVSQDNDNDDRNREQLMMPNELQCLLVDGQISLVILENGKRQIQQYSLNI